MTRVIQGLSRRLDALSSMRRIWFARMCGAEIGARCRFNRGVDLVLDGYLGRRGRIVIADECELMDGVALWPWGGHICISANVFIGHYAVIYGHGGVDIGDHTLISMHCRILSSNHTIPVANTLIRSQPDISLPTRIGRDVWLGAGVTVLGGVTIGDGCVVGAGAVVTHDLLPNSIALGTPATVVRRRD